jgi:hypothetical protein
MKYNSPKCIHNASACDQSGVPEYFDGVFAEEEKGNLAEMLC